MKLRILKMPAMLRHVSVRALYAIGIAAVLSCCNRSDELTWTEDVRLADGRIVTLRRWVEFKGPAGHLGDPPTESRQTLEFKHPETGQVVRWENAQEQGRLQALAIWLDGGKTWLLTEPAYGSDEFKYGCPNPPYLLYEHIGGQWTRERLADIPIKQVRANVTTHPVSMRAEIEANGQHVSAQQSSDSYTYADGVRKVPHILGFEGMPIQTFGNANCDRPHNYLLSEGEGK